MKIYFNVFNFIKNYQPYSVYILISIFLISSLLEAIGISFVMPVIALVLDDNFLDILGKSSFGKFVPDFILNMTKNEALLVFSILVISIYLFKNLILIFIEYLKSLFINQIKEKITSSMMNKFIHQDYIYHSRKNSSEINSTINQKITDLTDGLLSSILAIFAEIILVIVLLLLIIFFKQTNTFIILLILFSFGILSGKIVTSYIKKIGLKRQLNVNIKFKNFTNIINNVREIILTGKTGIYFKNFKDSLKIIAKADASRAALQRTPQLVFETIGITGLIIIIYYLIDKNASPVKIISTCTFFAAISYRAIPSLHKILFYHYNIRYYAPLFNEVINEINIENKIKFHSEKFNINRKLILENVSFKYEKENEKILDNLNLEIKINSSIGIFGKSGSGKTTLLDLISGLIQPSDGNIYIDDKSINDDFLRRKLQNNISYTSQKTTIINDSLKKNICFGVEDIDIDEEKYLSAIKTAHLETLEIDFNKNLKTMFDYGKNISGGQLQRIGIARALYQNKDILIFDEATNALDEELEEQIINELNLLKSTKTLIFVSHNTRLLDKFDKVYEVKNKNIFQTK